MEDRSNGFEGILWKVLQYSGGIVLWLASIVGSVFLCLRASNSPHESANQAFYSVIVVISVSSVLFIISILPCIEQGSIFVSGLVTSFIVCTIWGAVLWNHRVYQTQNFTA